MAEDALLRARPQLIANLGIVGINFLWHDGCDPEHPVNFTGPLFNFLALNNGYHGMHHEEPGMHWSRLPRHTPGASAPDCIPRSSSHRC